MSQNFLRFLGVSIKKKNEKKNSDGDDKSTRTGSPIN